MNFTTLIKTVKSWFTKESSVTVNVSSKESSSNSMEFDWNLKTGKFTESHRSKVIRLRKAGKTQLEIAKETGLTQNQIKGILHKLIESGSVDRKRKYTSRNTTLMMTVRKSKKAQKEFVESRKNSKIVQKGLTGKDTLIDMSVAPGTVYQDAKDWVKKYNIDVDKFIPYFKSHTCIETEAEFNLPLRVASKIGKQLGVSKRKFYTKKKITVK